LQKNIPEFKKTENLLIAKRNEFVKFLIETIGFGIHGIGITPYIEAAAEYATKKEEIEEKIRTEQVAHELIILNKVQEDCPDGLVNT
jgi:hypothetical protein